jgi:8-oxo-dGTP diphosphatase
VRRLQRLAAYALLRPAPASGAVVLVRASHRSDLAGRWFLPGGGVDHGEHPDAAVVREVREETGLEVRVTRLLDVLTDVIDLPHRDVQVHTVRLVYGVEVTGGRLRPEPEGSSDELAVVGPEEAAEKWLAPYVARALGLPPVPLGPLSPDLDALEPMSGVGGAEPGAAPAVAADAGPDPVVGGQERALRRLRIGTYGLARSGPGRTDPDVSAVPVGGGPAGSDGERVLLVRLADHVAGGGLWSLPGGGLDHGEQVGDGLRREVHEETGLNVRSARLLGVSSVHFTGRAPDGTLEDFHGVRLVHRVDVTGEDPEVVEVDGSTAEARWVPGARLVELPLVDLVHDALVLDAGSAPTIGR